MIGPFQHHPWSFQDAPKILVMSPLPPEGVPFGSSLYCCWLYCLSEVVECLTCLGKFHTLACLPREPEAPLG